jgi:hypothetical protein
VIEGAHLLGDETGAAAGTRRAECLDNTKSVGRGRSANANAARPGVAEAGRDLDLSVEKDESEK